MFTTRKVVDIIEIFLAEIQNSGFYGINNKERRILSLLLQEENFSCMVVQYTYMLKKV